MSFETTMANATARNAAQRWRAHRAGCPQCARNTRRRNWDDLCDLGYQAWVEHRAAQEELAENRRLDKLPAPDQGVLF